LPIPLSVPESPTPISRRCADRRQLVPLRTARYIVSTVAWDKDCQWQRGRRTSSRRTEASRRITRP